MSPRMAWRAVQAGLPENAIISSDIGNNCAIGNAYPTFEQGRKYLAPGMFGPCGYGFPAILGAKIAKPDVPVVGFAGESVAAALMRAGALNMRAAPADGAPRGAPLQTGVWWPGRRGRCHVWQLREGLEDAIHVADRGIEIQLDEATPPFLSESTWGR